jgi:DnaJ-class molecular chaperone
MPGQDDTWEAEADFERFLGAPEHAWWTGADGTTEAHLVASQPAPEAGDPYAVLRVARDASWEEILTAYRRQVRWWHPDGLGNAGAAEREACEDRIRVLNGAYYELRVRRGR